MKNHAYIFTKSDFKFWSYPRDYTKKLFERCCQNVLAPNQIFIHRNGRLVYYVYISRLSVGTDLVGLCFVLNGAMIADPNVLFPEFQYVLGRMAYGNLLLNFDRRNELQFTTGRSFKTADMILKIFDERICYVKESLSPLPPQDYSVSDYDWHSIPFGATTDSFKEMMAKYPNLYLSRFSRPDESTEEFTTGNQSKPLFKEVNKENNKLKSETQLDNKGKFVAVVIFLFVIVTMLLRWLKLLL